MNKKVFIAARKKGLRVQRNFFVGGWCVLLPGGVTYQAKDEKDLLSYIMGY